MPRNAAEESKACCRKIFGHGKSDLNVQFSCSPVTAVNTGNVTFLWEDEFVNWISVNWCELRLRLSTARLALHCQYAIWMREKVSGFYSGYTGDLACHVHHSKIILTGCKLSRSTYCASASSWTCSPLYVKLNVDIQADKHVYRMEIGWTCHLAFFPMILPHETYSSVG